jgi:hypothetical protein
MARLAGRLSAVFSAVAPIMLSLRSVLLSDMALLSQPPLTSRRIAHRALTKAAQASALGGLAPDEAAPFEPAEVVPGPLHPDAHLGSQLLDRDPRALFDESQGFPFARAEAIRVQPVRPSAPR